MGLSGIERDSSKIMIDVKSVFHNSYRSLIDSKYFLVIVFILGIVAYTYVTTPEERPRESLEFYSCIGAAHDGYRIFWINYELEKPDIYAIRGFNNTYLANKENCYLKYHSYFRVFGNTMTYYEINEKVKELEAYEIPRSRLLFEYGPIELQLEFYKEVFQLERKKYPFWHAVFSDAGDL